MRLVVGLLFVVACGGSRGPAWPKTQPSETDGGESLAPRTNVVLESSKADEEPALDLEELTPDPAAKAEDAAKPADAKPETPTGVTSGTVTPEDEVITTEEIVIEIED